MRTMGTIYGAEQVEYPKYRGIAGLNRQIREVIKFEDFFYFFTRGMRARGVRGQVALFGAPFVLLKVRD